MADQITVPTFKWPNFDFTGTTGTVTPSLINGYIDPATSQITNYTGAATSPITGYTGATIGTDFNWLSPGGFNAGFGYSNNNMLYVDPNKLWQQQEEDQKKLKQQNLKDYRTQVGTVAQETEDALSTLKTEQKKQDDKKKSKDNKKYTFWDGFKAFGRSLKKMGGSLFGDYDKDGKWKFNFLKSAATVVLGTAAVIFAPVCAPLAIGLTVLGAVGGVMGGMQLAKGIQEFNKADTFEAKDKAMEQACEGGVNLALSIADVAAAVVNPILKASKLAGSLKKAANACAKLSDGTVDADIAGSIMSEINAIGKSLGNKSKMSESLKNLEILMKKHPDVADELLKNDEVLKALSKIKFKAPKTSNKAIDFANKDKILPRLENIGTILKGEKIDALKSAASGIESTIKGLKISDPNMASEIAVLVNSLNTELANGKNLAQIGEIMEKLNTAISGLPKVKSQVANITNILNDVAKAKSILKDEDFAKLMGVIDKLKGNAAKADDVKEALQNAYYLLYDSASTLKITNATALDDLKKMETFLEIAKDSNIGTQFNLGQLLVSAKDGVINTGAKGLENIDTLAQETGLPRTVGTVARRLIMTQYRMHSLTTRIESISLYEAKVAEMNTASETDKSTLKDLENKVLEAVNKELDALKVFVDEYNSQQTREINKIKLVDIISKAGIDTEKDSAEVIKQKADKIKDKVLNKTK